MRIHTRNLVAAAVAAALPFLAGAAVVSPDLNQQLAVTPAGQQLPVIIQLADRVDLRQVQPAKHNKRDNSLLLALKDKAGKTQGPIASAIATQGGARLRQLWIINGIAVNLRPAAINFLAQFPGVGRITLDATVSPPATASASGGPSQWNLSAVHAPDLWALGYTGAGLVIANMDTGVDPDHPDLTGKWRGGANSWFDPHAQHATPYDASGHGTQTMGLMVGGSASGSAIGIAPDARWIAAKLFDDTGHATLSDIHLAFQWLLDPDGNTATVDTPDVVNASWGLVGGALGSCNLEFNDDIHALKAAGIGVVFSAGNDGPATATSQSPANNPEGYSAGAVDSQSIIASTSSRGPSGCDSSIFPKLVAPGVNVLTTDLSFGGLPVYATVSGTSFAAPHVAGLMALLAGAFPTATVSDLETALTQSAHDLGAAGADNSYGYGLVDGAAARSVLAAVAGSPPLITSTPVTTANQDQAYSYQVTATDPDGGSLAFALDTAPTGMSIGSASGLIAWTPTVAQVGANAVTVRVTDATGLSGLQSYSVTVVATNRPPVSANDSYSVAQGGNLTVAPPGVLANDSDPDGNPITAVLKTGPAHGSLTLNANGSFTYVPAAGYAGADSFTYAASDGTLSGNTATANITVTATNQAPVAVNDSFSAPQWRSGSYTPQVFAILANDRDADGTLIVASVKITTAPNKGGKVTVNADGTVSYTPKLRYTGTETFRYTVKDNSGATSNAATVTVTIR
jgi:VCBS repeat-containing protein